MVDKPSVSSRVTGVDVDYAGDAMYTKVSIGRGSGVCSTLADVKDRGGDGV